MKNKYYIMQNNKLSIYDKHLAESIYAKYSQSSLIKVLTDNTALLFNRAYTAGLIICDDLNSAVYLASNIGGGHESK